VTGASRRVIHRIDGPGMGLGQSTDTLPLGFGSGDSSILGSIRRARRRSSLDFRSGIALVNAETAIGRP
jgi:hypothetical protein